VYQFVPSEGASDGYFVGVVPTRSSHGNHGKSWVTSWRLVRRPPSRSEMDRYLKKRPGGSNSGRERQRGPQQPFEPTPAPPNFGTEPSPRSRFPFVRIALDQSEESLPRHLLVLPGVQDVTGRKVFRRRASRIRPFRFPRAPGRGTGFRKDRRGRVEARRRRLV